MDPLPMDADAQKAYWETQVARHTELLKSLGE
jgi:hypothetical protein